MTQLIILKPQMCELLEHSGMLLLQENQNLVEALRQPRVRRDWAGSSQPGSPGSLLWL